MKKPPTSLTSLWALLTWAACGAPISYAASAMGSSDRALETVAERSMFVRTGHYAEVERLCPAYAQRWPQAVKCVEFGRTPEGRPMLALVASRSGTLSPEEARRRNLPVMLMQAGIHAGEIDGKDAGFMALRELLSSESALRHFVLVFVPVFNVDGHERFGRWNRPNQVGPEEMGLRATAQNLNLNRDYTKADAPEMQAMLRLLGSWDPVLYVDMHVTDGSNFQYDVSNTVEPLYSGDAGLHPVAKALVTELNSRLGARGIGALDFYPELVDENDPASGFARTVYSPRYSTGYWALHNRFALLVETHSWKTYARRVEVAHEIVVTLADMMSRDGARWRELTLAADARPIGGEMVALDFRNTRQSKMIDFLGYAYTRTHSDVSGALATRYDPTMPKVWHVPLWDEMEPSSTARAPRGGYIVTAAYAGWMADKLALHGVRFEKLIQGQSSFPVETFRAIKVSYSQGTFEGRTMPTFEGSWKEEPRGIPAGSLFVPIAQPAGRVAIALLEPQAVDSLAAWGFFSTAFEAKEYMEPYVAEQVGAEMLARDPAVAADFKKRLAQDAQFAASPSARLEYFYRHSPAWDEKLNLYPVYKVETPLALIGRAP